MIHDLFSYPWVPGFKEPTTSRDAAAKIAPSLNERQEEVYCAIRLAGKAGMTADEVAKCIGRAPCSVRPRLTELGPKCLNKIERNGERRKNESGMSAAVWRAKDISCG